MKRNLKRKHLSHERAKGSVDHGKGAAAKFAVCPYAQGLPPAHAGNRGTFFGLLGGIR
jgi:hypothetical protein